CSELDEDFAAQRIKKLSLFKAVWSALFSGNKTKHKTLVDQFAYPLGGTGLVYERMANFVNENGGKVYTNMAVQKVNNVGAKVASLTTADGIEHSYDHVISSMPITHLVRNLNEVPEAVITANSNLKFRNTILVYLKVEGENVFPDNWLYVHASDLQMGRITNFSNWVPEINKGEKSTIVVLEYWAYNQDEIWTMDETSLVELGKDELRKTGLIQGLDISEGYVFKIPKCYPVYGKGYKEPLKIVEDYLGSF